MAGRIAGITIEIGGDTTKLTKALSGTDGAIKKTQSALKDINKLLKLDPGNTELLRQKYKDLGDQIRNTKDRLQTLRDAQRQMEGQDMTAEQRSQYEALQREIIETEQKLKGLNGEMREFGSVGAQKIAVAGEKIEAFGGKISAEGEKISGLGTKLLPVTGAIVGAGTAAVKTAANFEDGMASVQATLGIASDATTELDGKTVNVMESLEGLARQMGAETKFSATEAADAINILAMAGYDVEQIYSGLPQLLSLAAAGDLQIASAADITTGILAGFNMETDQSGDVVDKLAKLASSAKGDVSSFGAGLSAVAGQATSTGQSFDDVAAALGILGNNNIAASEGGTMLQRVLKNLYQPTDAAKEKLDELGIAAYNADGSARALPDVLEQLQGKLSSLNDEEKNQVLNKIFDTAAIRGATALIREAGGGFDELKGKILDSSGAAQQMADVRMDTLSGQLQLLKSATEEAGIAFGKSLVPLVKDAVKYVQKAVDWVNKLTDAQKKTILKVAAVTAAVGPALMIGGKVVSTVGSVVQGVGKAMQLAPKIVGGVKTVGTAILGLNPAVLAVTGTVGAVAGAVALWYGWSQKQIEASYGLTDAQKQENAALAETAQAHRDAEAARQDAMGKIGAEYGYYQQLAAELKTITDANGKVKEGYESRAAVITGILSQALGVEIGVTDGVIQKYGELMGTIDQVIEKKKAEAMVMAGQDSYTDAIQNVGKAQEEYSKKVNETADAQKKLAQAQQHYDDVVAKNAGSKAGFGSAGQQLQAARELAKAKEVYNACAEAEKNAADNYVLYQTTISNHEALQEAIVSGEGIAEAIQNVSQGFMTANVATKAQLQEQLTAYQQHYEQLKAAVENGAQGITDEMVQQAADMVEKAKTEYLKGGTEGGQIYDDGVAQGITNNKDKVKTAAEGVKDVAEVDLGHEGEKSGSSWGQGLIRGMLSLADKVAATANHVAGLIPNGTNMTLAVKSPSRVARKIGGYWDQGLIVGMKEMMPDVAAMSRTVSSAMIADAAPMMRYQDPQTAAARQAAETVTRTVTTAPGVDNAALQDMIGLLQKIEANKRKPLYAPGGELLGWIEEGLYHDFSLAARGY